MLCKYFIIISAVCGMCFSGYGAWKNALAPVGKAQRVILTSSGKSCYSLDNRSKDAEAVSFFVKNYKLLTGTDITGSAAERKITLLDNPADGEGYNISTDDKNNITVSGNVKNGIIALLTEDFGLRYYDFREGALSPRGIISEAEIVPRSGKPAFTQRSCYSFFGTKPEFEYANRGKLGKFGIGYVHTIFKLLPPEEFYSAHPEYFALVNGKRISKWQDGQICTSDPEVLKIVTDRVLKLLAENPDVDYLPVSQNDADGYCSCPDCLKIIAEEGAPSGAMLRFVNAVAEKVREKYPHVLLITEAYRYSLKPPKLTRPAENVVVRICLNNRISATPFHFVDETADRRIVESWSRLTKRLFIWDYITNFRNYLLPRADMPVLEHNLRYYRDLGIKGVSLQSNYSNELGTFASLRTWVITALCWNPDLNIRELAMDYIYGHYQQAAPAMEKYYDLLDSEWKNFHKKSRPGNTFVFSGKFYERASALLDEAIAAVRNNQALSTELAKERLTVDYYHLNCGLKNVSETADYLALLDKVKSDFIRLKVDHIMEGAYGMAVKQLDAFADNPELLKYTAKLAPGTVLLPASRNIYFSKSKIKDSKAMLGYAALQKNTGAWDMQFRFEDFPQLVPGMYRVSIAVRAPEKSASATGFVLGVYNNKSNSYALSKVIPASAVSKNEYRFIDCGKFEFTGDSMFLYTSVPGNSAFKQLYFDAVKFIPLKNR